MNASVAANGNDIINCENNDENIHTNNSGAQPEGALEV